MRGLQLRAQDERWILLDDHNESMIVVKRSMARHFDVVRERRSPLDGIFRARGVQKMGTVHDEFPVVSDLVNKVTLTIQTAMSPSVTANPALLFAQKRTDSTFEQIPIMSVHLLLSGLL